MKSFDHTNILYFFVAISEKKLSFWASGFHRPLNSNSIRNINLKLDRHYLRVQCTRMLTLPFIYFELLPFVSLLFWFFSANICFDNYFIYQYISSVIFRVKCILMFTLYCLPANEGLKYEQVDPPKIKLFHYERSVPIEIIHITR